jgi:glycosyltransferase involved in cell wall biosynthesis
LSATVAPFPALRSASRNELLSRVRIAVVLPAYRAERTVAEVVQGLPREIGRIVVVDDGSPDGTAESVTALADPRVSLVRHGSNRGVGAAMKTGYLEALREPCDVVVKMDADGQMDPAFLPDLVRPLLTGEAGYAKGNRLWSLSAARPMPLPRLLGNLFLSMATKAVSGYWNVLDPTNGFTAIRSDVLSRLDLAHVQDGYFFETSMLVELHLLRAPVRDVLMPARYESATKSSLRLVPAALEFPVRLSLALLRRLALEYLLLDFRPATILAALGSVLTLFGAVFGGYHWYEGEVTGQNSLPGTVMVAAVPFIVGLQLLLQALLLDIAEVRNFAPLPPLLGNGLG